MRDEPLESARVGLKPARDQRRSPQSAATMALLKLSSFYDELLHKHENYAPGSFWDHIYEPLRQDLATSGEGQIERFRADLDDLRSEVSFFQISCAFVIEASRQREPVTSCQLMTQAYYWLGVVAGGTVSGKSSISQMGKLIAEARYAKDPKQQAKAEIRKLWNGACAIGSPSILDPNTKKPIRSGAAFDRAMVKRFPMLEGASIKRWRERDWRNDKPVRNKM